MTSCKYCIHYHDIKLDVMGVLHSWKNEENNIINIGHCIKKLVKKNLMLFSHGEARWGNVLWKKKAFNVNWCKKSYHSLTKNSLRFKNKMNNNDERWNKLLAYLWSGTMMVSQALVAKHLKENNLTIYL
jgi:hypothetical protein